MDDGSRIRVMFVTPCFGFGGLERVLLDIAARIDRSRFEPSLCSLLAPDADMFAKLEDLDMPCTVMDKGEGISLTLAFRLARLLRGERIDLVNSHDIGATLYAAPAARIAGVEAVVHTDHSQILTKRRFRAVYRWILQHLVTRSITVSRDLEEFLAARMLVDRDRIVTVPNGIDVSRFSAASGGAGLRRELGLPEGVPVIGTIGRLTEQKGIGYLIEAFTKISDAHPGAVLVIVGDGELRGELESLAGRKVPGGGVIFTGIRDDIPSVLGSFDVFVLPSLWEGQPITIMEAMASGRPIVATDVGGNGEILRSGLFGRLVPSRDPAALADAVSVLLADSEAAGELGAKAAAHAVAELDSAAMVRRYEEVFLSCMEETPPA